MLILDPTSQHTSNSSAVQGPLLPALLARGCDMHLILQCAWSNSPCPQSMLLSS